MRRWCVYVCVCVVFCLRGDDNPSNVHNCTHTRYTHTRRRTAHFDRFLSSKPRGGNSACCAAGCVGICYEYCTSPLSCTLSSVASTFTFKNGQFCVFSLLINGCNSMMCVSEWCGYLHVSVRARMCCSVCGKTSRENVLSLSNGIIHPCLS